MKTERRHELQENELANWLGEKIAKIRPYGKTIVGVLVLAAVALLASTYLRGRNEQARQAAWSTYFQAMSSSNPEAFEAVAKSFPGTTAAGWALQRAGDLRLDDALRQMFESRDRAQEELEAARQTYQQLFDSTADPMLRQRSLYGLAKCLETAGDFEAAQSRYDEIVTNWPNSQFADLARERSQKLQQAATKQWYNWFAEQEPVRSPLMDPGMFQDLPNLPESPDLNMPAPGQLLGPGGSPATTPGTTPTEPAAGLGLEGDDPLSTDLGTESPADAPLERLDLGDDLPPQEEEEPIERLEIDLPGDEATPDSAVPPAGDEQAPLELDLDLPEELDLP